ncbi:mitogen-activated protein kinase kinase kinase 20-like [Corylus avellana]|uniref:mitogen-activated protein kinase kinase kinase 20-like n=1 Tax=Corylus avellana TaxID=13451 RepID=UPI001E1F2685|nr:mitogen-activated protein kinase kinase kinase 20-like [Corylus avellana]
MKRSRKEEDDEYSILWGELSWCRGPMIGQGAFGSVYRAELKKPRAFGSVVAVKSVDPINANSLMWENTVLEALQGCPHVIQTFGADTTETTNGIVLYNVLLEFASGGSLADLIVKSGFHGLSEGVVRKHTKSLLVGLKHIHARGFVHCDLKPDNVLLVATADGFEVKIADFGLAKRAYTSCETPSWRGTSWYIAPECVIYGVQEAFSDIWALGCTVLIMLTGKVPWTTITGSKEYESLMSQIGSGSVPDIPDQISKAAQDFLRCCFELNPMERMTADALLDHPFLVGLDETDSSSHLQLSKEEAANAKRIKRSPSYFPFGSRFIHFPFGRSFIPLSEAEVPEIQAENTNAVTSFPFGCSFIPLPDSSSEEGEEEVIQEPADSSAEQINWSAIFPKPLIRSRPLACWQHPFTFTTCAGA